MIRGIYTAAAGMLARLARQDQLGTNLANASTIGYKQRTTPFQGFREALVARLSETTGPATPIGPFTPGPILATPSLDLTQGPLQETGNPLDLALGGPGFFAVQTPNGVLYTRDGSFHRDADGRLATADGWLLLGQNGPVQVGDGDLFIDGEGIIYVDGVEVDRISLVGFQANQLRPVGSNYFAPVQGAQPAAPEGTTVHAGFVEQSNVDLVQSMVEMMAITRSYVASQRVLQAQDEALAKAANEIGRVG